jgi:DNA-binding transcriptional LysR family regulator
MALVAAGVGVAIVPEGIAHANPDVAIREIEIKVTREVGLAYSAKRPPSDVLRDLIARVRKQRPATKSTSHEPAARRTGR